jgi:hypothetical protein
MEELVMLFVSLVGVGSLISIVVNILKTKGWVKDGSAPSWVLGLNLVGMVTLFILQTFFPQVDIGSLDQVAGTVAQILALVFGLVLQLGSSKLTHAAVKGMPLIGKSYTDEFQRGYSLK